MFAIGPLFTPSRHGLLSHAALNKTSETIGFLAAQQQRMGDVCETIRKLVTVRSMFLKSGCWNRSYGKVVPKSAMQSFKVIFAPSKSKFQDFKTFSAYVYTSVQITILHEFKPAIQSNTLGEQWQTWNSDPVRYLKLWKCVVETRTVPF